MGIIGGLDVHRSQITYDLADTDSRQLSKRSPRRCPPAPNPSHLPSKTVP